MLTAQPNSSRQGTLQVVIGLRCNGSLGIWELSSVQWCRLQRKGSGKACLRWREGAVAATTATLYGLFPTCKNRTLGDSSTIINRKPDSISRDPRNERGVKVASSAILPGIFWPCCFWQNCEISHFSHLELSPLSIAAG